MHEIINTHFVNDRHGLASDGHGPGRPYDIFHWKWRDRASRDGLSPSHGNGSSGQSLMAAKSGSAPDSNIGRR